MEDNPGEIAVTKIVVEKSIHQQQGNKNTEKKKISTVRSF